MEKEPYQIFTDNKFLYFRNYETGKIRKFNLDCSEVKEPKKIPWHKFNFWLVPTIACGIYLALCFWALETNKAELEKNRKCYEQK